MSNTGKKETDEQLDLLDDLADNLAERTAQVPIAAQRIIKRSFPQLLGGSPSGFVPAYIQMGRAHFHWQLFLEDHQGRLIFFFSRKKRAIDNSFTTDINFSISPAAKKPPIHPTALLGHLWSPPALLELSPPRQLVKIVVKKTGDANPDNLLWLRLGPHLLAIAFDASESFQRSNLFYFKNRESAFEQEMAKKAPLAWFEDMLKAIRPWAQGETGATTPIDLGRSEGEIQKILCILSDNFLSISQKMQDAFPKENHPLRPYFPFYELTDYTVKVLLRLTSEGKVIREVSPEEESEEMLFKQEDLFQLEVQLKGSYEAGRPVIRFKILPPDFLTGGPLFDAFLQETLRPRDEKKPEKHLKKLARQLGTSTEALEKALTQPSTDTFIFRIQRKRKWDTQMFVLPIEEKGQTRNLFFSAEFEVNVQHLTVSFHNILSVKNLLKKKGSHYEMVHPGEKYFMRLLFHVNEWKNKVM